MENTVIFFGSNYLVLEKILNVMRVGLVICEKKQVNRSLLTLCFMRDIDVKIICAYNELDALKVNSTLGISCGFGIIFEQQFIDRFEQGILNIHFGDLPSIRGRHPISWTFLQNLFEVGVTFHLVDQRIDVGFFVHKYFIERSLNDCQEEIELKIIDTLPENIEIAINKIAEGKYTAMDVGTYYPSLVGKLDDIKSEDYGAKFILNCVRSQKIYGGIVINGLKVLSCYVHYPEMNIDKYNIIVSKDNIKLVVS